MHLGAKCHGHARPGHVVCGHMLMPRKTLYLISCCIALLLYSLFVQLLGESKTLYLISCCIALLLYSLFVQLLGEIMSRSVRTKSCQN